MIPPPGFDILHEDGPLLIVAKPGGVLTQAPPGIDSMEVRIKRFLKTRDEKPHKVYLGTPHRLDRPVSGAMVFAKNVRAARRIAEQFEGRLVDKKYWCLVEGSVEADEGTWTDYVRKIPGQAKAEVVDRSEADAKVAILHYRVLRRFDEGINWLEIELETGRTHQIRLQASARGLSILGDAMYGSTSEFGPRIHDVRLRWIALHARSLALSHPKTREPVGVIAPLPAVWIDSRPHLDFDLPKS